MNVTFGKSLFCGGGGRPWHWSDHLDDESVTTGIEAWVYALRGRYQGGRYLRARDLSDFDLVMLNLHPGILRHYAGVLKRCTTRGRVVGLYEGSLADLERGWREWKEVADRCDLIIGINQHGISLLRGITTTPVEFVGIPYPLDGIRSYALPAQERKKEIFVCGPLLDRPMDYLAARSLNVPMFGHERPFHRRLREVFRHRSLDRHRWVKVATGMYAGSDLEIVEHQASREHYTRVARSLVWMNLDPRYTWGRFVLDAAALRIPIITTTSTGHGPTHFPSLIVDTPYAVAQAAELAKRLLTDSGFYDQAIADIDDDALQWYSADRCVQRLNDALASLT